jgi:translocation and assembly module TamB
MSAPPSPAAPARRRHWSSVLLPVALVLFVAALVLSATLAARSEAGTRWLLAHVPGLETQGVQGSLWGDDLTIESLRWQGLATQPSLQIDGLELRQPRWRVLPHSGAWVSLDLQALKARRVQWRSARESGPAGAPLERLRLPFALRIDALEVAELRLDDAAPWRDLRARVVLGQDDGAQHHIADLSLHNDRVQIRADARIGSDAPLPLALRLEAAAASGTPWQAQVNAEGPLADFTLHATLRGESSGAGAPSLDADARIQPFQAWPLAQLRLSTRALDLAALSSAAPRTRIDAQADVRSVGLDQPARAVVELRNHAPGRLDDNRVPVRELRLEVGATPNRLDRIDIARIDAQLADERAGAGRVSGNGAWDATGVRLQLQLGAVEPARVHRHAGALRVSGRTTLSLRGVPLPTAQAAATNTAAPWSAQIDAALDGVLLNRPGQPLRAELALALSADALDLTRLVATSGDARASATLKATRTRVSNASAWQVRSAGELNRFDPLPWWPGAAGSAWSRGPHRVNGRWHLDAQLPATWPAQAERNLAQALAALRGQAQVDLDDSVLAGVPLGAHLALRGDGRTMALQARASAAGNDASVDGRWASEAAQDRWQVSAALPALAALQPLAALSGALPPARWPQAGDAQLQGQFDGRWPALGGNGALQTRGVRTPDFALQDGRLTWRFAPGDDPTFDVALTLKALARGEQRVDELQARVDGSLRAHRFSLRADSPLRPPAWTDNLLGSTQGGTRALLEGSARWRAAPDGSGTWQALDTSLRIGARASSTDWLSASGLQATLQLDSELAPRQAALAPGRLLVAGAALRWSQAAWRADGGRFDFASELEPLALAPLLARLQPEIGWGGDLALGGRIEVHAAERFDLDVVLARSAGDLRIADETGAPQPLGIGELQLAFSVHDGIWRFAQGAAGRQLGEIVGAQTVRTAAQARWPPADAPLEGVLQMRVANLAAWGMWVPPGWRLGGNLQLNAALGGRFGAPELRGEMRGADLSLRNILQGVNLTEGVLQASLDGAAARVQRLQFKGGDGRLQLDGEAMLGDAPSARLHLEAERFRLFGRVDRRIVASGSADLRLTPSALDLDGRFAVDEGLIDFSAPNAPSLDDDVTVTRAPAAPATTPSPAASAPRNARAEPSHPALRNARVNLNIGLGDKLRVRGRGLDAGLRGDLRLSTPGGRLAVHGEVRTAAGTYAAYAQKLDIERGVLAFSGAVDNPRLDILAIRPNLDVRVGVAVTGTLLNPTVRLFSEPDMADMDKLSWLILGRPSEGLGSNDTALLQRAALALLAGEEQAPTDRLLGQLGLTELSFRQSEGTTRDTVVSLGKQLSQRWYVGYERSINATTGTWQLIYRIAQRFTLRAQSGEDNAVDLIWQWRW